MNTNNPNSSHQPLSKHKVQEFFGEFLRLLADFFRGLPKRPDWLRHYQKADLSADVIAGLVVGAVVIPQSLGYAVLAGLPPVYGLYASIVPVLIYAWVGSSSVNAVGAVSLTAVMTAQALSDYQHLPSNEYAHLAVSLALLVGVLLTLASIFRLGWVTQFISRGVTAGFVSGASLLIFISQLKVITHIPITGNTVLENAVSLWRDFDDFHLPTFVIGALSLAVFWLNRTHFPRWFAILPLSAPTITLICRVLPLLWVMLMIGCSQTFGFATRNIALVNAIPQGLPAPILPIMEINTLIHLLPSAGLIALIAFVSSHAVASSFAKQFQQPFDANQELKGLGLANVIGAFFQSFAVTGGLSRTAINTATGAKTPLASVISVFVMVVTLLFFGNLFAPLPYAVLGAMIMASIASMIDLQTLHYALKFDKLDALAFLATVGGVLIFGLNIGLIVGILVSFAGLIWQSSHPHIAVVGQIGDTGHFRNVERHQVTKHDKLLIIRIDERLFYGNALSVRGFIEQQLTINVHCEHLVLMLSAVNHVDLTAQEMLTELNRALQSRGIRLHFSEIKGPIMDILEQTPVIKDLSGQVFLSTQQAVNKLS